VEWDTEEAPLQDEPSAPPESGPDRSLRAQILRRFETWLDEALARESPPGGLAAEILDALAEGPDREPEAQPDTPDLYSLHSAMTFLTQEVKLQGRTFRQLSDTLSPLVEKESSLDQVLDAHQEALAEARDIAERALGDHARQQDEAARAAAQRATREMLEIILDLRERLNRGLKAAQGYLGETSDFREGHWLRGLLGRGKGRIDRLLEAARSLEKGYVLTLDRLEEVLAELHVEEIDCVGQRFDPRIMNAVDVQVTAEEPEGTVLEVYRPGYAWNGELFRAPEVKVARAPEPAS